VIPLDEALQRVLEATPRLPVEERSLAAAGQAWLAEPVRLDRDLPPADHAAMDGFAIRAADAGSPGALLVVIGEIAAGVEPRMSLGPGQAVRIMTGALVPEGADAVVPIEETAAPDPHAVRLRSTVVPGAHVRRRGEVLREGSVLLPAGAHLGPAEVGLLAAAGHTRVAVRRAPCIGLLSTGDEVVEPDTLPGPAQIRNSNAATLGAQAAAEGARVDYLGIAADSAPDLEARITTGLERDVLVLSGGVSMGVYDLVAGALTRAGVEIRFSRVAIKPGKPTVFGCRTSAGGTTLVFGLPGNPVSCMVVFRLLVAPALRRMQGAERLAETRVSARLVGKLDPTPRREAFHPARLNWSDSGFVAEPVRHQGSGDLVAWRAANGMIRLPADTGAAPGDRVEALLDRDFALR